MVGASIPTWNPSRASTAGARVPYVATLPDLSREPLDRRTERSDPTLGNICVTNCPPRIPHSCRTVLLSALSRLRGQNAGRLCGETAGNEFGGPSTR